MTDDFPLADTAAARMLNEGLNRAKEERGLSIRQIGKQMNYQTAVVLSHMASGRVPIPIDRAMQIADILKLDRKVFLLAVVRQRHPDIPWELLQDTGSLPGSDNLALELQAALGSSLKDLNREQRAVMREVAADRSPRKRWLSVHELHAVETLRDIFPHLPSDGLDADQLGRFRAALEESR